MKKFTVAGIQMDIIRKDSEKNLERALELIDMAVKENAKVICLPELFTTGFDYGYIRENAETIQDEVTKSIGKKARDSGVYIVAGSIPEKKENRIYNTSLFFDTSGKIRGKYSKVHLFPGMDEDKFFTGGSDIPIIDTDIGKIGIMICYDLRFPEVARKLALAGVEIIFMPSEFPHPRLDHWNTLTRARAIENQIYFIGVNRIGSDGKNTFFGNTSIIDPWGEVISGSGEEECIVLAEIDLSRVQEVRKMIPCLENRIGGVY